MRHRFLIFGLLIACSNFICGQDNILIYSKQVSNGAEKAEEILKKSQSYSSVDFVGINLDVR